MLPDEPTRIGLVASKEFSGLKGIVEAILDRLKIVAELEASPLGSSFFTKGKAAELRLEGERLGVIGEIAPSELTAFDLRFRCSVAELDLGVLIRLRRSTLKFKPIPEQPSVARDLSLVVSTGLSWAKLAFVVRASAGPDLEELTYLDTFQGGNLSSGEQSLHFGLTFRRRERTLTGEEADQAVNAIVDACGSQLGAKLRV